MTSIQILLCLYTPSLSLSLLVRPQSSSRSLFQPWLQHDKELHHHLWQSLCVREETSGNSIKLHSQRNRKHEPMPDSYQKHLQLHSVQLQTVLFQWGLSAPSAGEIWGKVSLTYGTLRLQELFIYLFRLISSSVTVGFLRLLLCDELPQLDWYFHAFRKSQAGINTLLLDPLGSGQPHSSNFLSYLRPSAFPHCTFMLSLFEQIVQQHPGVKLKYLAVYCFSGTYILTLLTEGYNFTSESYSNIKYIKKVGKSQSTLSHFTQAKAMPLPGCPLSWAWPWPFVQTFCWISTQAFMSHFETLILIALMVFLKDYTGLVNWEEQTELGMA